jgi:predicted RNase H-like HicB family nuclease
MQSRVNGQQKQYDFTVVIERDEDGVFIAICPALQGCHTAGDTEEEALELIKDAIRLHVEARLELGEPIYQEVGAHKVSVAV